MIKLTRSEILLTKTENTFEKEGVMNPAVIKVNNTIHLFYRAVAKGNYSSIGYCTLNTPISVNYRNELPLLTPHFEYESCGMEDPRISKIDGLFYLTYTAYDGLNALGALATSNDLVHFEKHGIIVPKISFKEFSALAGSRSEITEKYKRYNNHIPSSEINAKPVYVWDKNVIFFPRRIHGKLHFMHRIKPEIQLVSVYHLDELTDEFWQTYFLNIQSHVMLKPKYPHEVSYIGGGCPPIETESGWLIIYHSVYDSLNGYVYCACAALMDLDNPLLEISRLPYPLFEPEETWELKGAINNVCFPTGALVEDGQLYIYYGAADEQIACASIALAELMSELLLNKH